MNYTEFKYEQDIYAQNKILDLQEMKSKKLSLLSILHDIDEFIKKSKFDKILHVRV